MFYASSIPSKSVMVLNCGVAKQNKSILIISDTHFPFHHRDTFDFLAHLKSQIKPDLVIHIGDEIDGHAWSYHEKETDSHGPDKEFELALAFMKQLYKIFPAVHVMHSNHGSLHQRKAKSGSIPRAFIKSYQDAFEAPPDWHWHPSYKTQMSNGESVLFAHGMGANAFNSALDLGISLVQGHFHSRLEVQIKFSPFNGKNIFGMTVGCLIDDGAYAYRYNRTSSARPKIGCGIILDGIPYAVPMILNRSGRWVKKIC